MTDPFNAANNAIAQLSLQGTEAKPYAAIAFALVNKDSGAVGLTVGPTGQLNVTNPAGNFETLAAARVLSVADHNKTFLLNLAGGFDITAPPLATPAFYCRFIVKTVPTTAYTITGATADKILGHVLSSAAGAQDVALIADPGDVVNFVANTAVQGDIVELWCDGAFYYVSCRCAVDGGITITG